jgi:demethoxyubiquinone hydroxylase (CLK1/Coq7/Cat5 family)
MSGIVAMASQWLIGDKSVPDSMEMTSHHIIESLLGEIQRLEAANARLAGDVELLKVDEVKLKTDGVKDAGLAVAEECAVICETADYVVRSYGCAREIRMKYGLPLPKH